MHLSGNSSLSSNTIAENTSYHHAHFSNIKKDDFCCQAHHTPKCTYLGTLQTVAILINKGLNVCTKRTPYLHTHQFFSGYGCI